MKLLQFDSLQMANLDKFGLGRRLLALDFEISVAGVLEVSVEDFFPSMVDRIRIIEFGNDWDDKFLHHELERCRTLDFPPAHASKNRY